MGTYYYEMKHRVRIPAEHAAAAVETARVYVAKYYPLPNADTATAKDVLEALEGDGLYVQFEDDGSISVGFRSEIKNGWDLSWLDGPAAQYIESGSYLMYNIERDVPKVRLWKDGQEAVYIEPVWPGVEFGEDE